MTRAPAADQSRLLEIQALDSRAARIDHRRATLPALAELELAKDERARADHALVRAQTAVKDLRREVAKVEVDVEQVRSRAARDKERLAAGTGSPRDLEALVSEIAALARRQDTLEEVELEAMERLESAEGELAAADRRMAAAVEREAELTTRADLEVAGLDAEARGVVEERLRAVADLAPGLLALYERIRAQSGGVGAAALRGNRCEGCRLELNPVDLAAARAAAPDEVVRCEECGRILVRVQAGG